MSNNNNRSLIHRAADLAKLVLVALACVSALIALSVDLSSAVMALLVLGCVVCAFLARSRVGSISLERFTSVPGASHDRAFEDGADAMAFDAQQQIRDEFVAMQQSPRYSLLSGNMFHHDA